MDQISNLLDQLYRSQVSEDNYQSGDDLYVIPSEGDATVDENFSQFSDNAVSSPPVANHQRVLPAGCAASSVVTDDEHLVFPGEEATMTAGSSGSTITSSQVSSQQQEDVTELESPDIENQILKEVDERTADTVIISSEDNSSKSNKEIPFKMTTSGLYLKYLCCQYKFVLLITICLHHGYYKVVS